MSSIKSIVPVKICLVACSHYACCNGDTWSSELGILSTSQPRLITSCWRRSVAPGTNGAMSLLGTLAAVAGGAIIGLACIIINMITLSHEQVGVQVFVSACLNGIAVLAGLCEHEYQC